jgi:hypothetical protein
MDAVTTVEIPRAGQYRVWVRTRDWVAPWKTPETPDAKRAIGTPGIFKLVVNGDELKTTFGNESAEWHWQAGGTINLTGESVELKLHDLTGFAGRCDAILLSEDQNLLPPDKATNCIEGNMGFTAGIAEMLVQSHLGFVHLLPALPTEKWSTGYVKGLKARGGYVVDVEWKNGKLTLAVIRSKTDGTCPVRYGEKVVHIPVKAGGTTVLDGSLNVKGER